MSAFCGQCSVDMFGEDFGDLSGFGDHIDLCETCGYVWVDGFGQCVDPECPVHGEKGSDAPNVNSKDGGTDDDTERVTHGKEERRV